MVEDFGNQEQMTAYVNYLFNAGATIAGPKRELMRLGTPAHAAGAKSIRPHICFRFRRCDPPY